jgi:hypothetical protein
MTAMDIPLCRYRQYELNQAVGSEILNQVQDDGDKHTSMHGKDNQGMMARN